MRTIVVLVITTAGASGAMGMSASRDWAAAFDARPEALMIGASLLLLASLLRHGVSQNHSK